jgi:hypothetical protein
MNMQRRNWRNQNGQDAKAESLHLPAWLISFDSFHFGAMTGPRFI